MRPGASGLVSYLSVRMTPIDAQGSKPGNGDPCGHGTANADKLAGEICPPDDNNVLTLLKTPLHCEPGGVAPAPRVCAERRLCYAWNEVCRCAMECPNCRARVSERAKFCSQCGTALALSCLSCGSREVLGSKFCAKCGATLAGTRSVLPISKVASGITPRTVLAERCHLTVMFCDLVGSTALSVHLDVEDFHEVIGAYQTRVAEIVTRFGGFVSRRVGDGVLVYFGYPNADEDDPEQAVRASLAVVEGIGSLENSRAASGAARYRNRAGGGG